MTGRTWKISRNGGSFHPGFLVALGVLLLSPIAAGADPAVTVQLPTFGVAIDADGALQTKAFAKAPAALAAQRAAAARQQLPAALQGRSKMRKVSLVKLEAAVQAKHAAGDSLDDAIVHLAGLTRVEHVFVYPNSGDVVIAGPAEGWMLDSAGRDVGLASGKPILLLEDLCTALRAYPPGTDHRPFLGCTIDPPQEGLARLRKFQSTIPHVIPATQRRPAAVAIAKGVQESLGMADVRVFGVSPKTHFAQVLVEADYRMKLIAIGREPPPIPMATFIGSLRSPRQSTLQRWWFVPSYQCVRQTPDGLAMQMAGQGVKLLGQEKMIQAAGVVAGDAPLNKASERFVESFTNNYERIAEVSPVYAQMRNMIDLAIAAAFLRKHDAYGKTGWAAAALRDEKTVPVETRPAPKRAPCVANSVWKGSRLMTPAGGGVSIHPDKALTEENLLPKDGALAERREQAASNAATWWWD